MKTFLSVMLSVVLTFAYSSLSYSASSPKHLTVNSSIVGLTSKSAQIYRPKNRSAALSPPSKEKPEVVVRKFLAKKNFKRGVTDSLFLKKSYKNKKKDITHLRMKQKVAGLEVYGTYVKAAVNQTGEIVHLIDNTVSTSVKVKPSRITPQQAMDAVIKKHYPKRKPIFSVNDVNNNKTIFTKHKDFYENPSVTRTLVPIKGGELVEGYLVQTWDKDNILRHTVVDDNGKVLHVELRTNNDSYNVFIDNPGQNTQSIVNGPGAGNSESPIGWVFSNTTTGNNVDAFLDRNNDDLPDLDGRPISATQEFLTLADATQDPSSANNQKVAVQNLFYLNNYMHDLLYKHGFDEVTGNFQEDNFGLGGLGGDSVQANAQDGGGTNNANFATPVDGQNPRMQMYLWSLSSPMRDGDLESDIVFHEYGHGLTWRMIGNMSGALSGAIGEGMSDALAILINEDDVMGSWALNNSGGIRRYPYSGYPLTYADVNGASPHSDGEIYAATIWRLWELWQANGLSKSLLFDYLIGGMNFTPSNPSFEDMRDGILATISDVNQQCLVWEAFAQFGIGHGASGIVSGSGVSITPSYIVSPDCFEEDVIAPDPISDLSIENSTGSSVQLSWTATGDDGSIGNAAAYEIRYATLPITEQNFNAANVYPMTGIPAAPGSTEEVTIDLLQSGTQYHFAIKVVDNVLNQSLISNVASVSTDVILPIYMENTVYDWVDTSFGNLHILGDDDSVSIPIGFNFEFYGNTFGEISISSNGYLTFSQNSTTYVNSSLPDSAMPNNLIAPFWDDLNPVSGEIRSMVDGQYPNRRMTIAWLDVPHYSVSGTVTFQAILYEGSNDIVFQYSDVNFSDLSIDAGQSATVGIENSNGLEAVLYSFNAAMLEDNTAIRFSTEQTPEVVTVFSQVDVSSDDAEENQNGVVTLTSTDLELVQDGVNNQVVGIRFSGMQIPQGVFITNAFIEFHVDESGGGAIDLLIEGQADVNPTTFNTSWRNISNRPRTNAKVIWNSEEDWTFDNVFQQTPDLTPVIQEIVNQENWLNGNAIAILVSGSDVNKRVADSFDGHYYAGPKLVVEYVTQRLNQPQMAFVPAGRFAMGDLTSPDGVSQGSGSAYALPVHEVSVPMFKMGQYEVTFNEYDLYLMDRGIDPTNILPGEEAYDEGWGRGSRPVINVSWSDVKAYLDWLNNRLGLSENDPYAYRLPTESEWEYAARAGTTSVFNNGDCLDTSLANYAGTQTTIYSKSDGNQIDCPATGVYRQQTVTVGSLPPGPLFGSQRLYEVHGNVSELVEDCFTLDYSDSPVDGGAKNDCSYLSNKVLRGGRWSAYMLESASSFRWAVDQDSRSSNTGFRLARSVPVTDQPTVSSPEISPNGGVYVDNVTVTLDSSTQEAILYYTLDGSEPTEVDYLYSGPFDLLQSAIVKVRGFLNGFAASSVASADFTVVENSSPIIDSIENIVANESVLYSLDISATDIDGFPPNLAVDIANLPNGDASFNDYGDGTGRLTWTPQVGDSVNAPYAVTVLATDALDESLFDEITFDLQVFPQTAVFRAESSVLSSEDDAEERADGVVSLTSSDLELVQDGVNNQVVGIRFNDIQVPQNARVTNAYIEFRVDEIGSGNIDLLIEAQAIADAPSFVNNFRNVSNRQRTDNHVIWDNEEDWIVRDEIQLSPNISSVIQEVISRNDWSYGNALAILISGSSDGKRVAESFNGNSAGAPKLVIEYSNVSQLPTVSAPTILPFGGTFEDSVIVTVNSETPEAVLYYTLDGSEPTEVDFMYTAPFSLTNSATLNVKGYLSGYEPSVVTSTEFIINSNNNTAPVLASIDDQSVYENQELTVSVSASDNDGTIPRLVADLSALPAGDATFVDFSNGTGQIRWTPVAGDSDSSPFVISVTAIDASDPDLTRSETFSVQIFAQPAGEIISTQSRVAANDDDAEERVDGVVSTSSSDLELVQDGANNQIVGIRFSDLDIPARALISNAYLEFQVDEFSTGSIDLLIEGELTGNSSAFTTVRYDISSRQKTTNSVAWNNEEDWDVNGVLQQSPDISPVIQEIINQESWSRFNALAILISGSSNGKRVAESFNGDNNGAPVLYVEYSVAEQMPTVEQPNILPNGGVFNDNVTISLETETPNAVLYYTLDGSDPTENDFLYSSQFNLTASATLKVKGFLGSYNASETSSANFIINSDANMLPILSAIGSQSVFENQQIIINVSATDQDGTIPVLSADLSGLPAGNAIFTDFGNGSGQLSWVPNFNDAIASPYFVTISAIDNLDNSMVSAETFEIQVVSSSGGEVQTTQSQIQNGVDDAEENANGIVSLSSSDLEFVQDGVNNQTVGMRFVDVQIPQGSLVRRAYIEFQVDEISTGALDVLLSGQMVNDAPSFTSARFDISARRKTVANIIWESEEDWNVRGTMQRSPDVSAIVEEIVNQPDWDSGNALAIIVTGSSTGKRVAESFNGANAGAPKLIIEYIAN